MAARAVGPCTGAGPRRAHRATRRRPNPPGSSLRDSIRAAALDAPYRSFIDLLVGQVAAGIANARAYEAERQRAAALAEIDRAKTTFFSNVSHEFRTPLTLLLGPLEEALNSPARALSGPELDTSYRNAVRLLKLVNALLDFARIEAGRVDGELRPDRPRSVHRRDRQRVPLRLRARRARTGCRMRHAGRARVRRPRSVREDAAQSAVERVEVHVRGRRDGAARGSATSQSNCRCTTPAIGVPADGAPAAVRSIPPC